MQIKGYHTSRLCCIVKVCHQCIVGRANPSRWRRIWKTWIGITRGQCCTSKCLSKKNTDRQIYTINWIKATQTIGHILQRCISWMEKHIGNTYHTIPLAMLILEAFVTLHARYTLRKCATVCVLHPSAPPMKEVCHRSVTVAFAICQVCHQCAGSVVTTLWCRGGERGITSVGHLTELNHYTQLQHKSARHCGLSAEIWTLPSACASWDQQHVRGFHGKEERMVEAFQERHSCLHPGGYRKKNLFFHKSRWA